MSTNRYLTYVLLLLIGLTIGFLWDGYMDRNQLNTIDSLKFTTISKSDSSFIDESVLLELGERFLFRKVADEVTPSVVYIETLVPVELPKDGNHDFSDEFWNRFLPRSARSVGSGVIISSDGYILTNHHVIEGAQSDGIEVVLNDKRAYAAQIIGSDPSTDLAVIKIDAVNLPSAIIGNSDLVQVGEWVMAVGNPFRLRATVTAGIISALGRDVQIIDDRMRIESFIQTDAAINKGNSGGALVNTSGQLIGINTAIASQSGSYQGYGFAVPSNLATKVASDIITYGKVRRPLLGVQIQSVDYNRAVTLGLPEVVGVEIIALNPGGAAQLAGVMKGDVVLSVDDFPVNASNALQERIALKSPGSETKLHIWRNNEVITIRVELDELPLVAQANDEIDALDQFLGNKTDEPNLTENPRDDGTGLVWLKTPFGFEINGLSTPEDPSMYDWYVAGIQQDSEAYKRGLRNGDQLLRIDRQRILTPMDLQRYLQNSLKNSYSVLLECITEDNEKKFSYFSFNK
jgi:serine protease Do